MDFFEYLDIIRCDLELRRYANQDGRWLAQIEHSEIKEGVFLKGIYGNGQTAIEALEDYIQMIRGRVLVINAYNREERKEYQVPDSIRLAYHKINRKESHG